MDETMEDSNDLDKPSGLIVPCTPFKPRQSLKFYVRRKHLNKPQHVDGSAASFPQEINDSKLPSSTSSCSEFDMNTIGSKEELKEECFIPGDLGFVIMTSQSENSQEDDSQSVHPKEEKTISPNSTEELKEKFETPKTVKDDSQFFNESGKKKNQKASQKKQRFHRPRILEHGRKPRNPATTRMRTVSKKRKKKESENEEEVVVEPQTPEKENLPKKRKKEKAKPKNEKPKKKVARVLAFDQETVLSCLELSRNCGPNFPKGRRRMARCRRSIWKKKSKRSNRGKSVTSWANIALSFVSLAKNASQAIQLEGTLDLPKSNDLGFLVDAPIPSEGSSDLPKSDVLDFLVDASISTEGTMDLPKSNDLAFLADVPIHTEGTLDLPKTNDLAFLADVPIQTKEPFVISNSSLFQKRQNKLTRDISEYLVHQMNYQKDHGLSSLADVPLHIEDTLMKSTSYVAQERPTKKATNIAKLIKDMRRLKINKRVTTAIKISKNKNELVAAKVDLDPETIKEWELLMVNDLPDRSYDDKETEFKWKRERDIFKSRIDIFINQMHLLQGDRKFKQWKGSVVDSVVGVFLTQNVSDFLSSNAFISVAAKFPADATEDLKGQPYYIEEPLNVNDSVVGDKGPTGIEENDTFSEIISSNEGSLQQEEKEKTTKRKNEKTGIIEDEQVDWESIRKIYTKEGARDNMYMDAVNWNAVRLSGQHVFATTIRKRGQFRILAGRVSKFLDDEARLNKVVDLEWLRNAPSDLVKRYLLEIEGIGLKSAECVRLLGLKHSAFPVDTNVGRIAIRLGWVPLEPLPEGVQMHQLYQYPSMDLIQKYLWPRLAKLPQETLYELHYQMITFGKVFCTKVIPNCNACPMKSECKYFASAYVSSKVLLQGSEENTCDSNTSTRTDPPNVDANMTSDIHIEEYASPDRFGQSSCCEPVVEFPSSPTAEVPELIDIEDIACRSSYQPYNNIPEIGIDMDALKKNVEHALLSRRKMLNGCEEQVSKALVVLTPENACIPIKPPKKMKYYNRLRTEHVVYVLPDNHQLLRDFERREPDDPSPYLLAIWQPGETSSSFTPPTKKCNSDGSILCNIKTCSYCWTIREQTSNVFRGTILIPCRTAMRGYFPLNGTYFQTNEVFADHETSLEPIVFPRDWCEGLETRALYCGSSVTSIFRFLDKRRIQLSFWTGFLCMRAFDRKSRNPQELVRRLHIQPGKKHIQDFDE